MSKFNYQCEECGEEVNADTNDIYGTEFQKLHDCPNCGADNVVYDVYDEF